MSTTTIRLPKELKEKVARVAERAGITAHGFILEAIAEKADLEERRADFVESAERRYASISSSGKTISWAQMRRYLELRLAGDRPRRRPRARRLVR